MKLIIPILCLGLLVGCDCGVISSPDIATPKFPNGTVVTFIASGDKGMVIGERCSVEFGLPANSSQCQYAVRVKKDYDESIIEVDYVREYELKLYVVDVLAKYR